MRGGKCARSLAILSVHVLSSGQHVEICRTALAAFLPIADGALETELYGRSLSAESRPG